MRRAQTEFSVKRKRVTLHKSPPARRRGIFSNKQPPVWRDTGVTETKTGTWLEPGFPALHGHRRSQSDATSGPLALEIQAAFHGHAAAARDEEERLP